MLAGYGVLVSNSCVYFGRVRWETAPNKLRDEGNLVWLQILVHLGPLWRESAPQGLGSAARVKIYFEDVGRFLILTFVPAGKLLSQVITGNYRFGPPPPARAGAE